MRRGKGGACVCYATGVFAVSSQQHQRTRAHVHSLTASLSKKDVKQRRRVSLRGAFPLIGTKVGTRKIFLKNKGVGGRTGKEGEKASGLAAGERGIGIPGR